MNLERRDIGTLDSPVMAGIQRKLGPKLDPVLVKISPLFRAIRNVGGGVRKVADRMGVSHQQLYSWQARGKIPEWISGNTIKVLVEEGRVSEEELKAGVPEEVIAAFKNKRGRT